jgi:hypothetical protein
MRYLSGLLVFSLFVIGVGTMHAQTGLPWMKASQQKLEKQLSDKYGDAQKIRIAKGLAQTGEFWRAEDGSVEVYEDFVMTNFAGDQKTLDELFGRYQYLLEQLNGHMNEIGMEFRRQNDLEVGDLLPVDDMFAGYDPAAHIGDDFFTNKIAFVALLNFPLTTLDQRLTEGEKWTRRQWAEVRLAQHFSKRIPAEANLAVAKAYADAEAYIAQYNIWMHHVLNEKGERLFPPKKRLLSHWNLRDEIKANYGNDVDGFAKQKLIQKVMESIVTQTIPAVVVNNPAVDWNPYTNAVTPAAVNDAGVEIPKTVKADREPDTRYDIWFKTFLASKKIDEYSPTAPTHIARKFDEEREIPEARCEKMLTDVLSSPLIPQIAKLIRSRLGRPLEPYDVYFNGFKAKSKYSEPELDKIVAQKYPTADAYRADMPNMFVKFGFTKERADYLMNNIAVEPARGSGHAAGPYMRTAKARLRTRVEKDGMNYKGYNIAVHEMGHNVEQVFSLMNNDYTLLQGVPNTAFTEALAFVFQGHDLDLLGLAIPDEQAEALKAIQTLWDTYEISGVALVDMEAWKWMYANPDATPAQFREAVVNISKDVWNKYYAPVFKTEDVVILGIYSHLVHSELYIPDYPIGHMIAFQIEGQMKKAGNIGSEFERMATAGCLAPDLWMKKATGSPVGPEALLKAAEEALKIVK